MEEPMTSQVEDTLAIIPSAGLGTRMGAGREKKNYMDLLGTPVLARTLRAFEGSSRVRSVMVVVAPGDADRVRREIVERFGLAKVVDVVDGGAERQDSVAGALDAMGKLSAGNRGFEYIVVHDGARPLVTSALIDSVIDAAGATGAAICAIPVKDTIKQEDGGYVKATLERERLRAVQTPQAFRAELLVEAHARALHDGVCATDESALVERLGIRVAIVEGPDENLKITTPVDMLAAEAILGGRMEPR